MKKEIVGNDKIIIGRRTDDNVREFAIDISELVECMDDGYTIAMYAVLPTQSDDLAYPISSDYFRIEGNTLYWIPTDADTSVAGTGKLQICLYNDNQLVNSLIYKTVIGKTLAQGAEPPEVYEPFLLEVEKLRDEAVEAKESAEQISTDVESIAERAEGYATQAQTYASNASDSATEASGYSDSAEAFKDDASGYADNASASALVSEGYAVGTQNEVPVTEGEYFENNSKYYAEQSALSAEEAKEWVETFFAELNVNTWGGVSKIIKLGYAPILYPVGTQFITHRVTNFSVSKGASTGITSVSIDVDKYLETMGEAHSTDEFTYDGAWHYDGKAVSLSDYGLTVTGTPDEGDQIIVTFTLEEFVWDVIGHDIEVFSDPNIKHSMTLQMHDCYTSLVFDAREALFAFPDGLEAGTYHFTITHDSWVSGDVGKTLQFTITNNIPAGGQLCFLSSYNATMVGSAVQIYASPLNTSAQETTTFSEGNDGTDLGNVSNAINGNINSLQRAKLGNNRYSQSAIRQVINSSSAPYGWTPQNMWDRISNNSVSGLLYHHDPDFVSVLGAPTETTALNTVSDGGGSETTKDKMFLVSRSQIFGTKENNIDEGEYYPYYSDDSGRTIKYRNGSATYWWLRSPYAGSAYGVRNVAPSGSLNFSGAYVGSGSAPACSLI